MKYIWHGIGALASLYLAVSTFIHALHYSGDMLILMLVGSFYLLDQFIKALEKLT